MLSDEQREENKCFFFLKCRCGNMSKVLSIRVGVVANLSSVSLCCSAAASAQRSRRAAQAARGATPPPRRLRLWGKQRRRLAVLMRFN